jgi:hypothetical protein
MIEVSRFLRRVRSAFGTSIAESMQPWQAATMLPHTRPISHPVLAYSCALDDAGSMHIKLEFPRTGVFWSASDRSSE